MAIWLGLDVGTQSLKAVLWQPGSGPEGGRVLAEASRGYETVYAHAHWAEQDPRDWERAIGGAIAAALDKAGLAGSDVAGLGITGQLDGAIATSADGEALAPAMIWQDKRSDCALSLSQARVQELTGQLLDPSHLAPKARWLQRRLSGPPAATSAAPPAAKLARFHQPVSFLVERLTGRAVMDPALASTSLLFALAEQRWSEELGAAWGLDLRQLPEVAPAGSLAGGLDGRGAAITGLPAGLGVAVGTGDDFTSALGAGLMRPGRVMVTLGTAEVVGALHSRPVIDRFADHVEGHAGGGAPIVETHAYPTGDFFIENPGWTCGGALTWLRRLVGIGSDAELDALAAEVGPGAGGVTFFPALAGAMTPRWAADVGGAFTGLSSEHDRRHLARAVLEGTAFACRDVVERLEALGVATGRVLLSGGGSRSRLWTQLRADVLGRPHELAARDDSAAIAAAMLAAVAAGQLALGELEAQAGAPRPGADPGSTEIRQELDEAYQRYRRDTAALVAARVAAIP
jgi:xylulokinase